MWRTGPCPVVTTVREISPGTRRGTRSMGTGAMLGAEAGRAILLALLTGCRDVGGRGASALEHAQSINVAVSAVTAGRARVMDRTVTTEGVVGRQPHACYSGTTTAYACDRSSGRGRKVTVTGRWRERAGGVGDDAPVGTGSCRWRWCAPPRSWKRCWFGRPAARSSVVSSSSPSTRPEPRSSGPRRDEDPSASWCSPPWAGARTVREISPGTRPGTRSAGTGAPAGAEAGRAMLLGL